MSKYEKYKPSGIDWIGEIPEHWVRRKVGRSFNIIGSGTTPESGKSDYYDDGSINWVLTGDLKDDIIYSCENKITQSAFDKHSVLKIFPKGTVLIALYGATIGKTALLAIEATTNQACCALAESNFLISKFTFYLMNAVKEYLILQSYGGGQPNISQDIIRQLRFYTPDTSEQLIIANYLDHQTQRIDRLIANKKAQAEKLKELRQIEINNAVTKGLNPNAELKDSGIDWLGKIPKHWAVKRLKNVSNFIQTGITPPSEKSEYYDGDIPWYGPGGFNGDTVLSNPAKYITQQAIDDYEAKLFPIDCIFMIGIGATIGKVGIIKGPSSCNQQLNIVNFKGYVSPDFGVYLLKTYENIIIKIANFSTLPIYNQVQTGNLKFLLPPKEEQLQIAKYLQERTTSIDKLIINIDAQIGKLQELRKIKIHEAVTGKIKVK